jgi:hypothetical protein
MIGPITTSSVSTAGSRPSAVNISKNTIRSTSPAGKVGVETQKSSEQGIKANANKKSHGALEKLRDYVHEFADGVLRPKTGLVGEKIYETSFSQTMENLSKKHKGALTGFNDGVNNFAFGILRPETGMIGEEHYDSSNSMTLKNLRKEHIGAVAGIKDIIRKYAEAAAESMGPPIALVEPIKVYQVEISDNSPTVTDQRV